jgi:hypothetical protein
MLILSSRTSPHAHHHDSLDYANFQLMVWPRAEALGRCLGCFLGDSIPVRISAQVDTLLGVRSPDQPKQNYHGSGTLVGGAIGP